MDVLYFTSSCLPRSPEEEKNNGAKRLFSNSDVSIGPNSGKTTTKWSHANEGSVLISDPPKTKATYSQDP
jgi:hypothetical protein